MSITRALLAVTFGLILLVAIGAQQPTSGVTGWYNGEWQSGIPGLENWYEAPDSYSRVYDEFTVPASGWTVVGVFSDNALREFPSVKFASWEIRRGMSPGHGGKVVAAGNSLATQRPDPAVTAPNYPASEAALHFRIQVDGLQVRLPAGRYWLSVAPIGKGQSYLSPTLGKHAVGLSQGKVTPALYHHVEMDKQLPFAKGPARFPLTSFVATGHMGSPGQLGRAEHFSQGVIVVGK